MDLAPPQKKNIHGAATGTRDARCLLSQPEESLCRFATATPGGALLKILGYRCNILSIG